MFNIKIKDLDLLNKEKENILELENKIEELPEVKELKKRKHDLEMLKDRINKYSTYDSKMVAEVLAKLMTIFEGIEYHVSKESWFVDCDYYIEPKLSRRDIMHNYPIYKIKNIKQKKLFLDDSDKKEICYLPLTNSDEIFYLPKQEYIQLFIDYLYERRSSKNLEEINDIELDKILHEFIEVTKDLQEYRKKQIEGEVQEKLEKQKIREFERSCVIDRKLIFNVLTYITNHYEENLSATQEKEKKWLRDWEWSTVTGYHKLIIKSYGDEFCFKTEIDSGGCYPDEEWNGIIDMDKDTDICFFDLKRELLPVLKNSNYTIKFINMIEELYNKKETITIDKIHEILVLISNEYKDKKRLIKQ